MKLFTRSRLNIFPFSFQETKYSDYGRDAIRTVKNDAEIIFNYVFQRRRLPYQPKEPMMI